jgi:hypothetical protein
VPAWGVLLKTVLASPIGKGAAWLLEKVGLKSIVEWAFKAVEKGVSRIGQRNKAIRKARHTIEGRWAPVIVEDRTRWVVYSDSTPVEIFPAITGDLVTAMQTFDLGRLRNPDEIPTARAQAWMKARLARMGGREGADAERSRQAEAIRDAMATSGEEGGQALFHSMVDELPALLDRLSSALAKTAAEHNGIPERPGIYLFSEGVMPVYVGQTRNLRARLRQHTSPSSRENQAALAWRIALAEAKGAGHGLSGTRKDLEADADFAAHFRSAKERVAAMEVRFIEIDDPVTRTVFEVYAARALGTDEFNSWETH